MNKISQIGLALTTATILGLSASRPATAVTSYSVTDIDSTGISINSVSGVNNSGQVVGEFSSTQENGGRRAFIWDSTNGIQNLGVFGLGSGGISSTATDINNLGQVVGSSTGPSSILIPFIWNRDTGLQAIPINAGFVQNPTGINDKGQVIEYTDPISPGSGIRSFIWDNTQGTKALQILPNDGTAEGNIYAEQPSQASDINNLGQVVGFSPAVIDGKFQQYRAVLWDSNGNVQDLGINGFANGINDQGQIVGSESTPEGDRAFLLNNTTGEKIDLGVLGTNSQGTSSSAASKINNISQVIGNSSSSLGNAPFIWENGVLSNLNDLIPVDSGWILDSATDISDTGYIVGNGRLNGQTRAFLLTPQSKSVPEPTVTLGLLAVAAFGVLRRSQLQRRHAALKIDTNINET